MVFDENILQEKLIEAWKLRSDETSFSASLTPLVAECRSEEEFRLLFTKQILIHIDSATSSNLLQSYFKFHTRSGYIHELLVIERLLSLTPLAFVTDEIKIKFLLELLYDTLKTMTVTAEQALRLGKQINLLAKWLCSALCIYSKDDEFDSTRKEMLVLVSNLFLLLFSSTTYYCLWLMTIKAQREQKEWRQLQSQLLETAQQMSTDSANRPDAFEQILSKITRLHLSEDFHQEDIEFNPSIFNPVIVMLVVNQLHKSSSVLLRILRFYEDVSAMSNPSLLYLRLLQASFGGYVASISTNNSEYQERWSAYLFFQLPRLLASSFESHFDHLKQAMENFLLHNEYILNRMDELCVENVLENVLQSTLAYTKNAVKEQHQKNINQLTLYIQKIRGNYAQQVQHYYQTHQTYPYSHQVLQSQRTLEQTLHKIFSSDSTSNVEENIQNIVTNLTQYIPLIYALDLYYPFIRLLLSYTQTHFDLALYILCYVTSITDDRTEEFGIIELKEDKSSTSWMIYVWLKKYWLARHLGHALFASPLDSIDLLPPSNQPLNETSSMEKEEFLNEIQNFHPDNVQVKYSHIEYLRKTVLLLGELPSLSLNETKQTVELLISYLTQVSYGSLAHVLLWLIANYQIANDLERDWIRTAIKNLGTVVSTTATVHDLLDAVKGQLWSDIIDNALLKSDTILTSSSSSSIINQYTAPLSKSATSLILTLSDIYVTNEFLDCEQARALYVSSKYVPIDLIITRLLININTSNGIYETRRALYFIFGFILFRRRSATRHLLQQILPYLINIKSNDFMLEPNVYNMCLLMSILLVLEFDTSEDQLGDRFCVKSWREKTVNGDCKPMSWNEFTMEGSSLKYEDTIVADAYHNFFHWASEELFSNDNVRPVNYFLGWLQTILWMFSRTAKILKPFIKSKLVAQLSEYIPLQFPIEKVLSILDLSNDTEIEYASMAITRDYTRLQTSTRRTNTSLLHNHQNMTYDVNTIGSINVTKMINSIPKNL